MTIHAYTSFSYSYLNRASVFAKTLKKIHPDWVVWAVIVDRPPNDVEMELELKGFDHILIVDQIFDFNLESWIFGHDVVEACTAVKAKAALKIFSQKDCEKLFYFDPDTAVLNSMSEAVDLLEDYSILLTPHQTDPELRSSTMAIQDNEIASLNYGVFNLGFIGLKNDSEGLKFLNWWNDRLLDWCYDRLDIGVFVDQKWCNLIPCFFDRVKVIRDPGYNVASWNLSQRQLRFDGDGTALINNKLLRFYHFTKLGSVGDLMTQRYAKDNSEIYELWWWYRNQVLSFSSNKIPKGWWFYRYFNNGHDIPKAARELYRSRIDLRAAYNNPFVTGRGSFYEWLKSETNLLYIQDEKGFQPV